MPRVRIGVAVLVACASAAAGAHESSCDRDHDGDACEVVQLTAASAHTCARTRSGRLYCWGRDASGQLGDGANGGSLMRTRPVRAEIEGVTDIAASNYFTCAVAHGDARCWGANPEGDLGIGVEGAVFVLPVQTRPQSSGVAVGEQHGCALTAAGTVECWGANYLGTVGNGTVTTENVLLPSPVVGLTNVEQVSAGAGFHTCALSAGALSCWGSDSIGQLGNGTAGGFFSSPQPVTLPRPAVRVAAGFDHTCVILSDRSLWCFGVAGEGALGIPSPPVYSAVPVRAQLDDVVRVAAGTDRTCAVTSHHQLYCFGILQNSALFGLSGFVIESLLPARVHLDDVADVAVGYAHTCALTRAGEVYCWGANLYGELGLGDTTDRTRPTRVRLPCDAH